VGETVHFAGWTEKIEEVDSKKSDGRAAPAKNRFEKNRRRALVGVFEVREQTNQRGKIHIVWGPGGEQRRRGKCWGAV